MGRNNRKKFLLDVLYLTKWTRQSQLWNKKT